MLDKRECTVCNHSLVTCTTHTHTHTHTYVHKRLTSKKLHSHRQARSCLTSWSPYRPQQHPLVDLPKASLAKQMVHRDFFRVQLPAVRFKGQHSFFLVLLCVCSPSPKPNTGNLHGSRTMKGFQSGNSEMSDIFLCTKMHAEWSLITYRRLCSLHMHTVHVLKEYVLLFIH